VASWNLSLGRTGELMARGIQCCPNLFDVNTSLKSVPVTPHVQKPERHEISSNLFRKPFHDIYFDPDLFDIIG
jgi:hypothetical protein